MKIIYKLLSVAILLFLICDDLRAQPVRETQNLNREWKFKLGGHPGAAFPAFDDCDWQSIGLPHSFSIPYFMSSDFYVGYGWYRKTLRVPPEYVGRRLALEFEGVFQQARVYVNGVEVGSHAGGYTGFSLDITDAAHAGDNLIAVCVDNLWNPRLAPRAGEHAFSGGIYRDVSLTITSPVHVAWYGTFVSTPDVSAASATVNIKTEVANTTSQSQNVRLETYIYNPEGKLVATVDSRQTLAAGCLADFDQTTRPLRSPRLWCPADPALYKAVSRVYVGRRQMDTYETSFGIRRVDWTATQGFSLNGERCLLRGANVHQDRAGWGDAATNEGMVRDVRLVKEAGFNFIRGSHYPHDPAFSRACDEAGMLFWSENAVWGTGGFSRSDGYWNASAYPIFDADTAGFNASARQQLAEMIRIHRNHPSIVAWSMCNEPFFTAPQTLEGMKMLLKATVALAHSLDPTRPAAIGGSQRPLGSGRIDKIGDIAGYNGDGSTIADFQNPGIANLVSEYGSTTAVRPGAYAPGWGDLARNDGYRGMPWRSGQAIWCAFDHGTIAGSELGKMGIIDYFRLPKRAWYWYRNEYAAIAPPAWPISGVAARLGLEADKTEGIRTDGTDDAFLHVTVLDAAGQLLSNAPAVTLTIVSGPGEFPTGRSITFASGSDIAIADGQAAIEVRSYYAGPTVIRATSPGLAPAEIRLVFTGDHPYVEGSTASVPDRPYTRFTKAGQPNISQAYGRNNPTFATTASVGYTEGLATDGDPSTYWQPTPADLHPAWTLDTERGLALSALRIRFPAPVAYRYVVEVSIDRLVWTTVTDRSDNLREETECQLLLSADTKARFIRISFIPDGNNPPRIAEVEAEGR